LSGSLEGSEKDDNGGKRKDVRWFGEGRRRRRGGNDERRKKKGRKNERKEDGGRLRKMTRLEGREKEENWWKRTELRWIEEGRRRRRGGKDKRRKEKGRKNERKEGDSFVETAPNPFQSLKKRTLSSNPFMSLN
jgi:hypothetical protein